MVYMMLTISQLAKKTGLSSYEIRRRVHNGTMPYTRVGSKQSKILLDYDAVTQLLIQESNNNMASQHNSLTAGCSPTDTIGYDRLRKIN